MKALAEELLAEIAAGRARLENIGEEQAAASRGAGKWTRKEILGHLIDSAANNHQRIVRAPHADPFVWPGYDQNAWVALHAYGGRPWSELVSLWHMLNVQVAHAMAAVPPERLLTRCRIGDNPEATLAWWMRDYIRHLRHHLAQILER